MILARYAVKRVYQMKWIQITRCRGRPTKTIREIIKNDIEIIKIKKTFKKNRSRN